MQFAEGQMFGRLGKLCMRAVTRHAFPFKTKRLESSTVDALRTFKVFLAYAKPRVLKLTSDQVWKVFTDACYEPNSDNWICGLGGVLVDPNGRVVEFFSIQLTAERMTKLGADTKKTIIFEAELLGLVLALSIWKDRLPAASMVAFIDNNATRDAAISGCGRNLVANTLIDFMLKLEMSANLTPWFARVPTPSNIADEPSRGVVSSLISLGASQVESSNALLDIFEVFTDVTDKRGSTIKRGIS